MSETDEDATVELGNAKTAPTPESNDIAMRFAKAIDHAKHASEHLVDLQATTKKMSKRLDGLEGQIPTEEIGGVGARPVKFQDSVTMVLWKELNNISDELSRAIYSLTYLSSQTTTIKTTMLDRPDRSSNEQAQHRDG